MPRCALIIGSCKSEGSADMMQPLLASIVFNNNHGRSLPIYTGFSCKCKNVHRDIMYKALLTRGAWAATGYSSRLVCLLPEARGRPRV